MSKKVSNVHKTMSKPPLTGDDSAVLAVLAQATNLSNAERSRLVNSLRGEAKNIGRALNGASSTKSAKKTAEAFKEWADDLGSAKIYGRGGKIFSHESSEDEFDEYPCLECSHPRSSHPRDLKPGLFVCMSTACQCPRYRE